MKYNSIKAVLRFHIKKEVKSLWTWKKGVNEEFTMIYNDYGDDLPIYTPQQLIKILNNEKSNTNNKSDS